MTNSTDLAAALLRYVPRHYDANAERVMYESEVLAALSRALDPSLTERAGDVLEWLSHVDNDNHTRFQGKTTSEHAADLITALLAQNAALRAQIDTMIDADTVQKMLDSAQPIMAEACASYEEANRELEAERDALRAEVRKSAMDAVSAGCQAQEAWEAQKAAEAEVEKLRGKIRDWEARIDACEWSTNSSLTEDIRAEMRATLTTEERHDG